MHVALAQAHVCHSCLTHAYHWCPSPCMSLLHKHMIVTPALDDACHLCPNPCMLLLHKPRHVTPGQAHGCHPCPSTCMSLLQKPMHVTMSKPMRVAPAQAHACQTCPRTLLWPDYWIYWQTGHYNSENIEYTDRQDITIARLLNILTDRTLP